MIQKPLKVQYFGKKMRIKNLLLKNFRNYSDEVFDFGEGLNILFPNNIELAIRKYENAIEIVAVQEEYVIFSKGWRLVQDEAEDKEE